MSLMSYNQLLLIISEGVIDALPENVNAASIDIRLGDEIEVFHRSSIPVDVSDKKDEMPSVKVKMTEEGYVLKPGQFILAHSVETFNLPDYISCEYKLKSSMARKGLNHMLAGWCDAGWNDAQLTMEFHNVSPQPLIIRPGMKCGQMIFFSHINAEDGSYAKLGSYNGQKGATKPSNAAKTPAKRTTRKTTPKKEK